MRTFHKQIKNNTIKISMSDRILEPLDPLIEDINRIKLENIIHTISNEKITIKSVIAPINEDFSIQDSNFKRLAENNFTNEASRGLYFYRNNRLIFHMDWSSLKGVKTKDFKELTRFRIAIEFNNNLDEEFSIEPKKRSCELPDELRWVIGAQLEKMDKKIKQSNSIKIKPKSKLINNHEDLWILSNGKDLSLNFESSLIKNIKDKNFQTILKKISTSASKISLRMEATNDPIETKRIRDGLKLIRYFQETGSNQKEAIRKLKNLPGYENVYNIESKIEDIQKADEINV